MSAALDHDVERVTHMMELAATRSPLSDGFVQLGMLDNLRNPSSAESVPTAAARELERVPS